VKRGKKERDGHNKITTEQPTCLLGYLQSATPQALYKDTGGIMADELKQAILGHSLSNEEGGALPHR